MTSRWRSVPRAHVARGWRVRSFALLVGLACLACGERAQAPSSADVRPRLVALVPSLTELVTALGEAEHLVARSDFDTDPAAVGLPSVGGGLDPSLETIVALDIDLVLVAEGRESPTLRERLEETGVQVAGFPVQTIDDVHRSIERLGVLLDAPHAADSLSRAIAARLEDVRRAVSDRPPVDVLYVVWSDPPMTTGGGTFIDEIITIAGGRNVFHDAPTQWPTVGFEAIVARDPDVVIWPQGEMTVGNLDRLRSIPGWREVRAIQEGRVVLVDGNLFNRPGPSMVAAARSLAEALHPEAF